MSTISIRDLIADRTKYPLNPRDDAEARYVQEKLAQAKSEAFLIVPTGFLIDTKYEHLRELIFKDWHLRGMFELSTIWKPYTNVQFILITLGKEATENITFSRYFSLETFTSKQVDRTNLGNISNQIIKNEYKDYLEKVEKVITDDIDLPQSTDIYHFWQINRNNITLKNLSMIYYEPELIENEKKLSNEITKTLDTICQIIKPKGKKEELGLVVKTKDFNYPLIISKLTKEYVTDTKLAPGDILFSDSFSGIQKFYLVNKLPVESLYASTFLTIIRITDKTISPEYLFLYLQSATIKKYFLRNQSGGIFPRMTLAKLKDLPVIVPEKVTVEKSKAVFESLFLQKKENIIEKINKELFDEKVATKPIQKEFLVEELENLRIWKKEIINKILKTDFSELEKCKENKLYKSFLILSGSILEAFLLDWISELENKNYFDIDEEEYTLGKLIWKKLKIAHPDVFDEELIKSASVIKDKRNLVHPKVYFNSLDEIDDKVCTEVLEELRAILRKRK